MIHRWLLNAKLERDDCFCVHDWRNWYLVVVNGCLMSHTVLVFSLHDGWQGGALPRVWCLSRQLFDLTPAVDYWRLSFISNVRSFTHHSFLFSVSFSLFDALIIINYLLFYFNREATQLVTAARNVGENHKRRRTLRTRPQRVQQAPTILMCQVPWR